MSNRLLIFGLSGIYTLYACIGAGYEALAASVVLGIGEFRKNYGEPFEGGYVMPASWQLAFTAAAQIGIVFGGLLTGPLIHRFGRQLGIGLAEIIVIAGVLLQWFSNGNRALFFVGKLIVGCPIGIFSVLVPGYCSEVTPIALRGAVTATVNWSIGFGQLLAYIVMTQTINIQGPNAYKILFAVQWMFAGIGLLLLPFFLESPYHLVAKNKIEEARSVIKKLYSKDMNAEHYLEEIRMTLAQRQVENSQQLGYKHCFTKENRMRTLVACSTFFIQANSGIIWVGGYVTYFLELAGMPSGLSANVSTGMLGLAVVGNMFGWFLIEKIGRRGTSLWGTGLLSVVLFMIGIMSVINKKGSLWAQVAFMALWNFLYQATIGAVAWPIIAEVPSSTVRSSTMSLAVMTNEASNTVWSFALPYVVNPDEANLGGKIAFVFGSILVLCTVFVFFTYPETQGRRFVDIDELYKRGISPRRFRSFDLNLQSTTRDVEARTKD
ncbi:sugar transporter, putative [Talaromyces stipitatus ATCC 10500]|uniref:Sugar transporter, putative n=1 Tax=Talaromyces stipitatus (strain ATCC 10500 / CBS 375.48 / QM 6759 / NRRL 1006) TaxID=441959 RepID=B8LXC1_TALSN|nr:sugar transporter, putative [Talaromyces stipitatus ATCC 10500]EED23202.1 sugar transporter, putative [Talaromyces stipitatus ATCC 10500]